MLAVTESGSGQPVVCLHGVGSHRAVWDPVVPRLAESHRVLTLDLPGFGDSPPLPEGVAPSPSALAAAVADELDRRGLDRVGVVGNSLGGLVAIHLAALDRASAVVAISPAGMATPAERSYSRAVLKGARALGKALRPAAPAFMRFTPTRMVLLSWAMARPWRVDPEVAVAAAGAYIDSPSFDAALDAVPLMPDPAFLERVTCPVAILWGTRDLVLPVRQQERWAQALPHARTARLPGLGHTPMSDAPDAVADAILEGLAPGSAGAVA